jgi:hypothetical protein
MDCLFRLMEYLILFMSWYSYIVSMFSFQRFNSAVKYERICRS